MSSSESKATAEVVSLQQGTKFDLTLSHEACDNDEYLVTDVAAPVGVCAASKNVLTYTPPFDFIGRVVVAYKTTVKGQEPEDQTLLIDVTEAPKPEVTRLSVPQGATVKIALTAEGCDDDEFDVEEATAELGACSLEKNVLTFTSPADKLGDVLLTYRGRVKGGPPQVREIVVTVTEAQATLETTAETIVTTRTRMTTTVKTTSEIPHVDDHDAHIEWATVMAQLVDDASAEAPSKAALITALQDNPHADDAFLKAHKIHPDSKMATIKKKVTIKSLAIALRAFGTKVEGVKADSGALAPVSDGEADALYDMCTEDEKTDMVKFDALIKAGIDVRYKNENGYTALMVAASMGNLDTVKALVAADPNLAHLNLKSSNGTTALAFAIMYYQEFGRAGCAEGAAVLCAAGAQ